MANPVFIPCPKDVFTKVATGVTTGQLHKVSTAPANYLQTYKLTGEAAPANTAGLGVPLFEDSSTEEISSSDAIDVYVMCTRKAGNVRVDI